MTITPDLVIWMAKAEVYYRLDLLDVCPIVAHIAMMELSGVATEKTESVAAWFQQTDQPRGFTLI